MGWSEVTKKKKEKTSQTEKLSRETDSDLFQEEPQQVWKEIAILAQTKWNNNTDRQIHLLPTKTNISNVEAIIIVIMEILGVNCSIPHNLLKEGKDSEGCSSSGSGCTLTNHHVSG